MENDKEGIQNSITLNTLYNAMIQIGAILSYQYFVFVWPMYFVMGMIITLGVMQTMAAAYVLGDSSYKQETEKTYQSDPSQILIGLIYMISSYQIYLLGFEIFAGFALAHSFIYTLIVFYRGIKK